MAPRVLVTYQPKEDAAASFPQTLGELARITCLPRVAPGDRVQALQSAEIIVGLSLAPKEIEPREFPHLKNLRFVQLVFAGADNVPFALLPEKVTIAGNVGAFAEPIAEHVLAMALTLAKSIVPGHRKLAEGVFDQKGLNKRLEGGICGVIGLGGNGEAIARMMKAVGMRVYGINRSGRAAVDLDFIGGSGDMEKVLKTADLIVLSVPLTRGTRNLIGDDELSMMKTDAILINVARGAVIDQKALYRHLKTNPRFGAGIDTWWSEPASHGSFALNFPFFELPNLIGSPHNADHVQGAMPNATRRALENVRAYINGQPIHGRLNRQDYAPAE